MYAQALYSPNQAIGGYLLQARRRRLPSPTTIKTQSVAIKVIITKRDTQYWIKIVNTTFFIAFDTGLATQDSLSGNNIDKAVNKTGKYDITAA
jgi:hypothetical protein